MISDSPSYGVYQSEQVRLCCSNKHYHVLVAYPKKNIFLPHTVCPTLISFAKASPMAMRNFTILPCVCKRKERKCP